MKVRVGSLDQSCDQLCPFDLMHFYTYIDLEEKPYLGSIDPRPQTIPMYDLY